MNKNEDNVDQRKDKRDEEFYDSIHLPRLRETYEEAEDREVLEAACSSSTQNGLSVRAPFSAWNLLSALQVSLLVCIRLLLISTCSLKPCLILLKMQVENKTR